MRLFSILIFILSFISFIFAPLGYDIFYLIFIFVLFLLSGYISVEKDIKEKQFFSFSVFFFISFFLVSFAYPLFIYDLPIKVLFMDLVNEKYISKATALCQLAFSSYTLGLNLVAITKIKKIFYCDKKNRINYFILPFTGFTFLVLGFLFVEPEAGNIINYNTGWAATIFLLLTIYSIIITFFSKEKGIYSKRYILYLFLFFSTAFLLFIVHDRGFIISVIMALLACYSFFVKQFHIRKVLYIALFGVVFLHFIGVTRVKDGGFLGNLDEIKTTENVSKWEYLSDLTSISRNIYEGYEYKEINGSFKPARLVLIAISPIPFMPRIVTDLFFDGFTSSGLAITRFTKTKAGIDNDYGLGTHCVIDVYMSWGVIGVIFAFLLLGYIIKKSRIMMQYNLYYAIVYVVFTAYSIYIPRSTIYQPYRLIVWMMLITFLLSKYTYSFKRIKY